MKIILIYFAIKYLGDWDLIYKALESKEKVALTEIKSLEEKIEREKWKVITILDIDYPEQLKHAYKPPFVIWYKGDIKLLKNKFICATGNQEDSSTIERLEKFIPEIEKSFYIINPGFKGLDEKIKEYSKNQRLSILARGLEESDNDNLVMTEYPFGCHPTKKTFRERNRLIATFSETLVLFSSLKDGPINNLISNFLNLGKEINCFPGDGSPTDGNSELIKQGANLITSIKDISKNNSCMN